MPSRTADKPILQWLFNGEGASRRSHDESRLRFEVFDIGDTDHPVPESTVEVEFVFLDFERPSRTIVWDQFQVGDVDATLRTVLKLLVFVTMVNLIQAHGLTSEDAPNTDELVGKHNTGRQCLSRKTRAQENEYQCDSKISPRVGAAWYASPCADTEEQRKREEN
jgi:hypothetical protein